MERLVLIADAEAGRAESIGEACSIRGFATRIVSNGAEALEAALHRVPDVLVASARLGVIEASKVAEILRANPRTQNVQFVLVGGPGIPSSERDASMPHVLGSQPEEVAQHVETLVTGDSALDAEQPASEAKEEVLGRIAQIPLPDLLQLFHLNRRSGTIELRRRTSEGREARGRIYMRDGDVVQAVAGSVEGEKALFRLLGWVDGSFSFRPERVALAPRIQTPTRGLLLEGMRQLDEWRRTRAALPALDSQAKLTVHSGDLPNVVHPLTQEVLFLLEIYSRVGDIVDHCPFPDYQVLRTLHTLVTRGIIEIRSGLPSLPSDAGLFTEAQTRRLREWLTPTHPGSLALPDAKLLLVSPDRKTTRDFIHLLESLPGMRLEARFQGGEFSAEDLAIVGRLHIEAELGIEFVHVPAKANYASLWPLAAYGALGTLVLLGGSVAEAETALRPALENLRGLPRSRIFYVLLLREGEAGLPDELRENLSLLDDGSLFLLPLDNGREPIALLRRAFSRILP